MPVSTAPARLRQAWPSARAASPVIHWLVPSASAVRPSSDAATFMRTHGRPRCMREKKPMFSSRDGAPPLAADDVDLDAGRAQARDALAGDQRIRVFDGDDDPGDAGLDQRIAARRRAAVVRAGFEGDVGGGAARRRPVAGVAQRHHLGVGFAGALRVRRWPMLLPSASTMTQPTRGLGSVRPMACAASTRASARSAACLVTA